MPVTSPARTLLDLAAVLSPEALRRAARQAQAERRVNVRQLREIVTRANGHRGVGALRAIVADGPAPTRSDLEDVVLDLLDDAGIERPEINAPLRLDGRTIIPDFLWRERRLAIEADSRRWHDAPAHARATTPTSRRSSKPTATASCASTIWSMSTGRRRRSPGSPRALAGYVGDDDLGLGAADDRLAVLRAGRRDRRHAVLDGASRCR